ncbi:hypothetical protein H6789_03105 [Candidatus Nomurabacteria bacterium]|nr:hypothetical protein [Candidatus Nomurabacteria bacterium]
MNGKMSLEAMPYWIVPEDRHCRACDKQTDHVMVVEDKSYTYPCCATDSCQKIVCGKIEELLDTAKV